MVNMIRRLVACGLLLCACVEGEIRPTNSIQELANEATPETLVFCDIDDTLLRSTVSLGWGEWWNVLLRSYVAAGVEFSIVKPILGPSIGWIFQNIPLEPMEATTADTIREIQARGITVLGLTARNKRAAYHLYFDHLTREHLSSVKIDFMHSTLSEGMNFNEASEIDWDFIYGVIFTSQKKKGPPLAAFLTAQKIQPKRIVLIDDRLDQLISVDEAMAKLGIPFLGLHYQRPARPFSLAAANVQWHMLMTTGIIPSDEEALRIRASYPQRSDNFFVEHIVKHIADTAAFHESSE